MEEPNTDGLEEAYDLEFGDYRFRCWYVEGGDAIVVITFNGDLIKSFNYPSYKIWNIPAHAQDIIQDLDKGLVEAGRTF